MAKAVERSRIIDTYTITLGGASKTSELVRRGNYDWFDEEISDERFPLQSHPSVCRTLEFIECDYVVPNAEEVLEHLVRHGLKRPTYEDGLEFGVQYPDYQTSVRIVFMHEPVRDSRGDLRVLSFSLGEHFVGPGVLRSLNLSWFAAAYWSRMCVFAGVREE